MVSKSLQAIRGMNDILPEQTPLWRYFESTVARLLDNYGYKQIRMPIVEFTELFKRSIGEVTDIVEKEMYTFEDRNGDSLTLRPEGTAACVRAVLEHGITGGGQTQKLWYIGPMFRHERPQKGRYRQFHQIGCEVFNLDGPDIDAELIVLTWRLWGELGIRDAVKLELNSLGTAESRGRYREALVEFLSAHLDKLDEDSQRRLKTNPLRVLDTKNADTQAILVDAPKMAEYLDEESRLHFEGLKARLDAAGIPYVINQKLVRGLDYYSKTVFEWTTDKLGAQGTVCAGGRYDGLFEQIGGKPTPAVGFAAGMERLIALWQEAGRVPAPCLPDAYVIHQGEGAGEYALLASQALRAAGHAVVQHAGGGSFKSQMKKADASGALLALIVGEDEVRAGELTLKHLRRDRPQTKLRRDSLVAGFTAALKES